MALSLLRNKRWPIALDVGADSVKMLQLHKTGNAVSVRACGRRRLSPATRGDEEHRRREVVAAVRELLRGGQFRSRRVISALPSQQLSIKNIRLPRMPRHETARAVSAEAKERFNFEFSPDRLKFLVAGEVRKGDESHNEIIALAVPEETIREHLTLLDEIGLAPEHVEAEPVALFRGFEGLPRRNGDDGEISVIMDVGFSGTCLVVARGPRIIFIKSIDTGADKFNRAAASRLNLSYSEAAGLRTGLAEKNFTRKKASSGNPLLFDLDDRNSVARAVHDAVRGELEELIKEVSLCLRYCSVTFRGLRPRRIILAGGEAYDPSLSSLLRERLNVECAPAEPLKGIDVSHADFGTDRRGTLSEWALCAGLAMRNAELPENMQDAGNQRSRLSA